MDKRRSMNDAELKSAAKSSPSLLKSSSASSAVANMDGAKTIFFVRHAESHWNRWQRTLLPSSFRNTVDAPITARGYQQACTLQQALRRAGASTNARRTSGDGGADASLLSRLTEAEHAWISPLTRCLQTALVGLLPLYEQPPDEGAAKGGGLALTLKPIVREQKSFGWDNIGAARGDGCRARACRKLQKLKLAPKADMAAMLAVSLDAREAQRSWWTRTVESRAKARARALELLHALLRSEHSTVIVVSHSNFLRELFAATLSANEEFIEASMHATAATPSIPEEEPADDDDDPGREQRMPQTDLARALATRKLPNCAVVGCELVQHADTGVLELHNLSCWTPSDGARLQPPAPRRTSSRLSARFTTPAKVAPA